MAEPLESGEKSSYEDQTRFAGSRISGVSLVAAVVLALSVCTGCDKLPTPRATSESPSTAPATERVVGPLTPADAQALATMNERVKEYVALHVKLERSLPKLPKEATPEQIDKNQRALARLVLKARAASGFALPYRSGRRCRRVRRHNCEAAFSESKHGDSVAETLW